MHLFFHGLTS